MPSQERLKQLREDKAHAEFAGGIRGLNSKALRERGGKLVAEMRQLSDTLTKDKPDFSAEDEAKWQLLNAHYDLVAGELEEADNPLSPRNHKDRLAELEAKMKEPARTADATIGRGSLAEWSSNQPQGVITEKHRTLAIAAWFKHQMGENLSPEMEEACRVTRLNPAQPQLHIAGWDTERIRATQEHMRTTHPTISKRSAVEFSQNYGAALSDLQGSAGAYTVPPETLIRNLEVNMLWYGGMRQVSETMVTATGERMSWPTADDTGNTGVQLEENQSIGSSVDPTFGKVYWDAYKFSSKPILVPYELLQDSVFNLPTTLGEMLGIRLGRITNTKFTLGNGNATAKGITIAAASGATAAADNAIAGDDILTLFHSIDPAYRTDVGFMCHDSIVLAIRKIKDGMGRYMWQDGLQNGVPERLLNLPLQINQDMSSTMGTGAISLICGRLSNYKIRRVGGPTGGIRLYRLQERYRDTDQDAFIAFLREDGNLLTAGTTPVKYLSHP